MLLHKGLGICIDMGRCLKNEEEGKEGSLSPPALPSRGRMPLLLSALKLDCYSRFHVMKQLDRFENKLQKVFEIIRRDKRGDNIPQRNKTKLNKDTDVSLTQLIS